MVQMAHAASGSARYSSTGSKHGRTLAPVGLPPDADSADTAFWNNLGKAKLTSALPRVGLIVATLLLFAK